MRPAMLLTSLLGGAMLVACSSSSNNARPAASQPKTETVQAAAPASAPSVHVINMKDMKFEPSSATIKVGDTVEWKNPDIVTHNAAAADNSFNTQKIAPGASGKWTATKKGSFPYTCTLHPNMKASLTVE